MKILGGTDTEKAASVEGTIAGSNDKQELPTRCYWCQTPLLTSESESEVMLHMLVY